MSAARLGVVRSRRSALDLPTGSIDPIAERVNMKRELRAILVAIAPKVGLAPHAIERLVEEAELRSYEPEQEMYRADEHDIFVHLVLRGHVKLTCPIPGQSQIVVTVMGPGMFFGLASLFDPPGPRRLTAAALDRCLVAAINQDTAMTILDEIDRRDAVRMMAFLWRVLSGIIYDRARAVAAPVTERIILELRRLAEEFGAHHERGVMVDLPLKRRHIAELVGAPRPTIDRALSRLRRMGVLDYQSARWLLVDRDAWSSTDDRRAPV